MRLFVNVNYPESENAVHKTMASAAEGKSPGDEETVEIEFPGTLAAARRELLDFSADGLRSHYPLPGAGAGAVIAYTLPTDSEERKNVPVLGACVRYFAAALAGVAKHSKAGNDKHNKGQPLHHARWKSMDHEECIQRHLIDMQDIRAFIERNPAAVEGAVPALLAEANAMCWRSLALSQALHEQYAKAPRAPAARLEGEAP